MSPDDAVAPRVWAGLAVVAAPCFVVALDAMVLYVAFGDIRRDVPDVGGAALWWILPSYTIVVAAGMIGAGRWADRLGCSSVRISSALVLGCCLGLMGCARAPAEALPGAPVTVTVGYLVEGDVTDNADFTARLAAVDSVEVRAHVWGYLDRVNFKEGALVQCGSCNS